MRIAIVLTVCLLLSGCDFMSLKFKFVTAGGAVDDAAIFSQVLYGRSLLPLPPANVRGYVSLSGNMGLEWNRRARVGAGLRPSSDVPIAEEVEQYEVEVMNGSTVLRTIAVSPIDTEPVLWDWGLLGITPAITLDESWLDSHIPIRSSIVSRQVFHSDNENFQVSFWANTTSGTDYRLPRYVGLIPVSAIIGSPNLWIPTFGFQRLTSAAPTTLGLTSESGLTSSTKSQLVIKVNRGIATLYQDPQGGLGIPLGAQSIAVAGDYRAIIVNNLASAEEWEVDTPRCLRSQTPSTVYFYNDMVADFGGTPATITFRVYQLSAVLGRGPYAEYTLTR